MIFCVFQAIDILRKAPRGPVQLTVSKVGGAMKGEGPETDAHPMSNNIGEEHKTQGESSGKSLEGIDVDGCLPKSVKKNLKEKSRHSKHGLHKRV